MSVNSRENKGLLWQLLSNHPFQKEDSKKFQAVLEYRVNEIHKNRFKFNNNLMSMNKEIIKQFANEVPKQTQPATPSQPSKAKVFETRLKVQQDNFDTLINKQKPAEIDFSDKTEEAPVDARMVDNTLQQREQELKKIMSQYNNTESTASKWIQGESTSSSKNLKIDKDSNVKIKPFVFDSEKSEKHVKFEIEERDDKSSNAMSFLTKLKKTNVKEEEVISYLKRIEEKQDIIITLLRK